MRCRVKLVSLGQNFTAAVTTRGKLFLWGRNDLQQLGIPLSSSKLQVSPSKMPPRLDEDPLEKKEMSNHTGEEVKRKKEDE
ncbi:hect-domain (ubiquitin-transferase) domain-containing protein, partial [Cystoisospora suis]